MVSLRRILGIEPHVLICFDVKMSVFVGGWGKHKEENSMGTSINQIHMLSLVTVSFLAEKEI